MEVTGEQHRMYGKIIKGISGFYYVYGEDEILYECHAKGIFRKLNMKPLVGDDVEIEVLDAENAQGNLIAIRPRHKELIRPAVANIDQALIVFAITRPEPNFNLLDRFLIYMQRQDLPCVICFNKSDIASEEEQEKLQAIYSACGCKVLFLSTKQGDGIQAVRALLEGKTTAFAGPSGVGKSSLINTLCPHAEMEVGEISKKIARGKNTTRHTELFALNGHSFIMDTPGFSSLDLFDLEKEDLHLYYPEFAPFECDCRFNGCQHMSEPDCAVKEAVSDGRISQLRYENYTVLYRELKDKRKY